MIKHSYLFVVMSLLAVPAVCQTKILQEANRELINAALAYGLTNKRTIIHQEEFDAALAQSHDLNKPVLIDPGAMSDDAVTMTPLMAAAYSLSYYMILRLIAAGADPHLEAGNGLDAYGWVRSRTWIARLFPQFQQQLDAALSLKPETPTEKEFVATLTEVYRLLEPRLTQRWGGFYGKKQHAGVVEYLRTHHHTLMDRAANLLSKTRDHHADYEKLLRGAKRLLKDVEKIVDRPDHHPHPEKHF